MLHQIVESKPLTTTALQNPLFVIHQGDSLDVLRGMADDSVDAVVTDPPYGLSEHKPNEVAACMLAWAQGLPYTPHGRKVGFMGKTWDAWVPGPEVWKEVLRVLKPGGHALVFAGTRSMDLMGVALRLAGFELRDAIGSAHDDHNDAAPLMAWVHGQGFPKSRDISKDMDRMAGCASIAVPNGKPVRRMIPGHTQDTTGSWIKDDGRTYTPSDTVYVSEQARTWAGWGTALKPAWEPILVCRKPIAEPTVAQNVLRFGTGAMHIDACRVPVDVNGVDAPQLRIMQRNQRDADDGWGMSAKSGNPVQVVRPEGRFPANVVHDGSDAVLDCFPDSDGQLATVTSRGSDKFRAVYGAFKGSEERFEARRDTGSAARFFYCAKPSRSEKDAGLDAFEEAVTDVVARHHSRRMREMHRPDRVKPGGGRNTHPTVKPVALCRYLVRLVTPPGGTVLDPFAGSGTTGVATLEEGLRFIGIDIDAQSVEIAKARCAHAARIKQKENDPC